MSFENYRQKALEMGAANAAEFATPDIAFDPRVVLKCIFGCPAYGKNHTCPYQKSPLTMDEYKEIFSYYKGGIIIGCKNKEDSQRISFEIEREAFLDGNYFAFSLSDCGLCKECTRAHGKECAVPMKARPSFHGVGIDVFKTVHKFQLPLAVAKTKDDETNWYSAVFIS